MPKMTFVCPTWNRIAWLPLALQSLLSQSETDIEIIVVNDASTDGTKEFLNSWAVKDPRVKVIHNEKHLGAGISRNIGAEAASAKIIGVCDDDDVYMNTRAEDTLRWFEKNPKSELVNFPHLTIDYFENIIDSNRGAPFDHKGFKEDGGINYFCNPAAAYKRDAAISIGGYPSETETMTDDYQFVKNWIKSGRTVDFCGDNGKGEVPFVTMHRILPSSIMSNIRGFDPRWLKKQEAMA